MSKTLCKARFRDALCCILGGSTHQRSYHHTASIDTLVLCPSKCIRLWTHSKQPYALCGVCYGYAVAHPAVHTHRKPRNLLRVALKGFSTI